MRAWAQWVGFLDLITLLCVTLRKDPPTELKSFVWRGTPKDTRWQVRLLALFVDVLTRGSPHVFIQIMLSRP